MRYSRFGLFECVKVLGGRIMLLTGEPIRGEADAACACAYYRASIQPEASRYDTW